MNKKIVIEISIGIILLVAIVTGGIFWLQSNNYQKINNNQTPADPVGSNYSSQKDCEKRTGKTCNFAMCDIMPQCEGVKTGWQPQAESNNNVLKSCADGKICDKGYVCYDSQYGGMGSNGIVSGPQEGDLSCHKLCNSNSDCKKGKCKEVELVGGDVINKVKFCSEK